MEKFKIGDRVRYVGCTTTGYQGKVGTIVQLWDEGIGAQIRFDGGNGMNGALFCNLVHYTEPALKFGVGDRVAYVGGGANGWKLGEGTVVATDGKMGAVSVKWSNDKLAGEPRWMFAAELALVDETYPAFKAGDRVVFTGTDTSVWRGRTGTVTEVNRERGHYYIRVKFDNEPVAFQWVSPDELTPQPAPKFAIGDRVRTRDGLGGWDEWVVTDVWLHPGSVREYTYKVKLDECNLSCCVREAHLERIEAADPAPAFKVGERVRITGPYGTHYVGLTGTVTKAFSATSLRVPVELDDRAGLFFFQRENVRHIERLPGHVSNHRCMMDPDLQYVAQRELPTEHAVTVTAKPSPWLRKAIEDVAKKTDAEVRKQLAEQVVAAEAKMCELQKRVEETLAENNRLDADCDKLRGENKRLDQECNRWQDRYHEAQSERVKLVEKHGVECELLTDHMRELRLEIAALKDEAAVVDELIVRLTERRKDLEADNSKLSDQANDLAEVLRKIVHGDPDLKTVYDVQCRLMTSETLMCAEKLVSSDNGPVAQPLP